MSMIGRDGKYESDGFVRLVYLKMYVLQPYLDDLFVSVIDIYY